MTRSETSYSPAGTPAGLAELRTLLDTALDLVAKAAVDRPGPVRAGGPAGARAAADAVLSGPLLPEEGCDPADALTALAGPFADWSVDVTHPAALARMQCPPTAAAVAAEVVAATLNQSLHAWESGPFGLALDRWVIAEFGALVGYDPATCGGTLTAGGSVSNLMALIAARDTTLGLRTVRFAAKEGLPALGVQPVVVCPEGIHFSIQRGARIIGIGEDALRTVPTDADGRMRGDALERVLAGLPENEVPVAVIACAGSTDLGVVDPLDEIAEVTERHGVWLHADAAYGGGALFSPRLRGLLKGIERADSVTLDLHKFGWVPASAAIMLVRAADTLASFGLDPTTCLSADDDTLAGYIGSQNTSLQTTRRVDALKIAVTLRTLGARRLAELVDTCHDLARHAAARLAEHPRVEVPVDPPMTALLFRYLPAGPQDPDAFNGALRRRVMEQGRALIARTHLNGGRVYLKLIMLNPDTTPAQVDAVIADLLALAEELDTRAAGER
ncbi:pyridoxal phosphate-dependent decarboxylase family protein [Saccharothrix lopnurensis]|uniref:Pyridoxal phosphate-dependent decarboxylase family protein n=1 Tax=Saccharothrix lopnurensis TaxID=1670621 RepID=A0ABW1NWM0_9PSEU